MPRHKEGTPRRASLADYAAFAGSIGTGDLTPEEFPVEVTTRDVGVAPKIVWTTYCPPVTFGGVPSPLPVILVHGANHSAEIYDTWDMYLARLGVTVHAVDLRGHGPSTLPPTQTISQVHLADYAEDLWLVVQALGLTGGDFILAGHSLGGAVVQLYALAHPVTGLAILASTALPYFMRDFLALSRRAPLAYLTALVQGSDTLFDSPAKIRRFLLEPDADDDAVWQVQRQLGRETKAMTAECLRWMGAGYRPLQTHHLLLLGGAADVLFPPRALERSARFYQALAPEVQIVPATPHDLMVGGTWQACADQLANFIETCALARRTAA